MTSIHISATTVTYFSDLDMLSNLVDSLYKSAQHCQNSSPCTVMHYMIDNSENDDYFAELASFCNKKKLGDNFTVTPIQASSNLGYGGGNNLILGELNSDYHLIINPDVTVKPNTLLQSILFLDNDLSTVMLTPKVFDNGKGPGHVVKTYPDCLTLMVRYLGVNWIQHLFRNRLERFQCKNLGQETVIGVDLAGGCFLFLRTSQFRQLGGFDDSFFMYFEDFDLSIRSKKLGKIAYVPAIEINHFGGDTGRKHWRHHLFFAHSALKFFNKYTWKFL